MSFWGPWIDTPPQDLPTQMTGARQLVARFEQTGTEPPGTGEPLDGVVTYNLSGAGLASTTPFSTFYTWRPDSAGGPGDRWQHSGRFRLHRYTTVDHPAYPDPATVMDLHGPTLFFLEPDAPTLPIEPMPEGAIGYEVDGGEGNIELLARTLHVRLTSNAPTARDVGVRALPLDPPPGAAVSRWWTRQGPLGPESQSDPDLQEPGVAFVQLAGGLDPYRPTLTPTDVRTWPRPDGEPVDDDLLPAAAPGAAQTLDVDVPIGAQESEVAVIPWDQLWALPQPTSEVDWLTEIQQIELTTLVRPPRFRYLYAGTRGSWRLRQRQSLPGADSWPTRQRQHGGHTGSWPVRQRQTGV